VVRVGLISEHSIPTMSATVGQLFSELGESSFWSAVWHTVEGWALGLGIAMALGIPIGVLVGSSRWMFRAFRVPIEFLRPIPSVALIPLAVLVYGTGLESKVFLSAFACFWPMLIQTMYGVQDVDPVARDTARVYGVGTLRRFRLVVAPTAAPYVATGLRLSGVIGMILAIAATLLIGGQGLGAAIAEAQQTGRIPTMFDRIFIAGLLGVLVTLVLGSIEARFLRWHTSNREVTTT
jgi:ABC-type nitrate/sulfonate/bicarbonate transport system permease component